MFTRFVRLGVPYVMLDAQGRMRSSLADLFRWNYGCEFAEMGWTCVGSTEEHVEEEPFAFYSPPFVRLCPTSF